MMSSIFGEDYKDFLLLLNKHDVEYLLIGGYTVILYGYPRTTGDLDVWIKNSDNNRVKLIKACHEFGLMTTDLTPEKFNDPGTEVFTFGRPPVCIELLIKVQGFEFDDAYKNFVMLEPDGFPIKVVSFPDLVKLKTNAGRPKDLDDLNNISDRK